MFSAHSWSSALNTAASLHMLASSPHADCTDFKPMNPQCSMNWSAIRGYRRRVCRYPRCPGLGVTVREDIVEKYLF